VEQRCSERQTEHAVGEKKICVGYSGCAGTAAATTAGRRLARGGLWGDL